MQKRTGAREGDPCSDLEESEEKTSMQAEGRQSDKRKKLSIYTAVAGYI